MAVQSIEDFVEEWINRKYASRIIKRLNTEHENLITQKGGPPDHTEYEWMRKRWREIHGGPEFAQGAKDAGKKAEDQVRNR